MRKLILLSAALAVMLPLRAAAQQCGGEERWAVKVAADPGASLIDDLNRVNTPMHDLVRLTRPTLPSDDFTRTAAERIVRVVEGRLVKFKKETGKTGDSDFHLVISDETLLYSPGGAATQPSPHSVVAEIVDPNCVGGRHGTVTLPSRFQTQLLDVHGKFLAQFTTIKSGWNDAEGIPVRLTGITYFDRPHGQVGRALNGLELHPLLDIEFNPTVPVAVRILNPGFEDSPQVWTASTDVITDHPNQPARTGQRKAWLGGYGTPHTDRISQQVTLPAIATAISLAFYLHIDTEETNQVPYDRLRVRIRDTNGNILRTLQTFTNQNAAPGFELRSFDITQFKGRTIRIELEAQEDNGSVTSFVVDDFALIIES